MGIVSGTFTTYPAIGNREDLSNVIYNITPTETPFMTMVGRGKADAVYTEWQTDSLASADDTNAQVDGDDASYGTAAPTTRVGNRCQISRKTIIVSGRQDAVNKAGRSSEFEYQAAKRAKELKRDMEKILVGNQASSAGSTSVPAKLGSLEAWIATNDSRSSSGAAGGFSSSNVLAATDGTSTEDRTFTETLLKTSLKDVWASGGDPDTVMVGPVNKQKASAFAGIATLYRDTAGSKRQASILGAADVYVSDFGEVKIIANRYQRERTAFVLQSDMWSVDYLRPFRTEPLAKTGDAKKAMLIVDYTLRAKNEAASGVIADLIAT